MGKQYTQGGQVGLGHATSGAEDATPTHESMTETGGSGGPQLTQPRDVEVAPVTGASRQDVGAGNRQGQGEAADDAEAAGTDATAIARGYQDTRSRQASPGSTGLGTPETGGNQTPDDLAPPRG
ncbi:hypothetical protein [uncultured Massilia sp.]|uniref:hypothetical protein n=1 Tax=uncultured Massilia sp. TaxID=169973 RepID=UPI0025F02F90|nr:hypothetical protein [uncultured Massilia sp.]